MRASAKTVLAACAASCCIAACGSDPTSLLVTVRFDDGAHHPERLDVTLAVGTASPVRMNAPVTAPGGRALRSGDSFAVLLGDDLAGDGIEVRVTAVEGGLPTLAGAVSTVIVKHSVVRATVTLDGGGDGGARDAAIDAAPSDGPPPDQSVVAPPSDFTGVALDLVAAPLDSAMSDAVAARDLVQAPQDLLAPRDLSAPPSCAAPLDVSAGGRFSGSTAGYPDRATGSCGGAGSPDFPTVVTIPNGTWRTVTVDTTGSAVDFLTYLRPVCDLPAEIAGPGPCVGATAGCAPSMGGAHLVACGLPPGSYYPWLDAQFLGAAGTWTLNVATSLVDLNSCRGAGALVRTGVAYPASTTGHLNAFTSNKLPRCGDRGAVAGDATFYVITTRTQDLNFTVAGNFSNVLYLRSSCGGNDIACAGPGNSSTLTALQQPAGTYFLIVDGNNGATGDFTVTFQ